MRCYPITLSALALASSLPAQMANVPMTSAQPGTASVVLPANTEISLAVDKEVSSKTAKVGDTFSLSVANDVMLGQAIAIPRGTHATAEITSRTGKGVFGKSAKLEIQLRTLSLAGRDYKIMSEIAKAKGKGNTPAVLGSLLMFGPFAAVITGKSAVYKQGQILQARTVDPIPITVGA